MMISNEIFEKNSNKLTRIFNLSMMIDQIFFPYFFWSLNKCMAALHNNFHINEEFCADSVCVCAEDSFANINSEIPFNLYMVTYKHYRLLPLSKNKPKKKSILLTCPYLSITSTIFIFFHSTSSYNSTHTV